jgi:hypothetical protein
MTTPTPKDASAMRTALVEVPHPASITPPSQPPEPRSSSPGLRCPSSTTPTTGGALAPPSRRRLVALTPKDPLVMTGLGLPDTIAGRTRRR